jgi:hypothetical protein
MSSEFDGEFGQGGGRPHERRGGWDRPSLFWPIVLIALGGYFLMLNFRLIPPMSWTILLKIWPVLIIIAGLDVLLRRVPGFIGSLLGALLALALIGGLGYLMFNYENYPDLFVTVPPEEVTYQHQDIAIGSVDAATVVLDMGSEPSTVDTLAGEALVVLDANTARDLELVMSGPSSEPTITLESSDHTQTVRDWPYWLVHLSQESWSELAQEIYVTVSINPDVPTSLELDSGSGPVEVHLSEASISDMQVNAGSGPLNLWLPGEGRYEVRVNCGSGSLDITLPSGLEARIEVADDGSGPFDLSPRSAFNEIERGSGDEGIWETPGFQSAENAVTVVLETGSGPVNVMFGSD